jgi:SAM-dependent methyltransferase
VAVAQEILRIVVRNQLAGLRRTPNDDTGGTQSRDVSASAAAAYVERSFAHLLMRSKRDADAFRGARVMELGPGDNLGLALRFIAAGARKVVAVDRFHPAADQASQLALYEALRESLSGIERERFDSAVTLGDRASFNPDRIELIQGVGIEAMPPGCVPGSFDFIVSIAVLEHIDDNDRAFETMDRLLKPGGVMLHQVDLSDHGIFSRSGGPPLQFLTIPDVIWRAMISNIGGPNRQMRDYYRRTLDRLGYDASLVAMRLAGEDQDLDGLPENLSTILNDERRSRVREVRPKLIKRYAATGDDDLLVSGLFITAQKR